MTRAFDCDSVQIRLVAQPKEEIVTCDAPRIFWAPATMRRAILSSYLWESC